MGTAEPCGDGDPDRHRDEAAAPERRPAQRLALPRSPVRDEEIAATETPFMVFTRLAARCTGSRLAVLVIEEASGLQVHAVSGPARA